MQHSSIAEDYCHAIEAQERHRPNAKTGVLQNRSFAVKQNASGSLQNLDVPIFGRSSIMADADKCIDSDGLQALAIAAALIVGVAYSAQAAHKDVKHFIAPAGTSHESPRLRFRVWPSNSKFALPEIT